MIALNLVVGILLAIVVGFDMKKHEVPAVLTTSIIFILAMVNINHIQFGAVAFVFGWLLYEFEFFEGIADVKVITAIGLMCSSLLGIFALIILVTIYGTIYRAAFGLILKKKAIAFTVPLFLIYLTMWILSSRMGGIF